MRRAVWMRALGAALICLGCAASLQAQAPRYAIVPAPRELTPRSGGFALDAATRIVLPDEVALGAGWHPIEVVYVQIGGLASLDVAVTPPGGARRSIPEGWLGHQT